MKAITTKFIVGTVAAVTKSFGRQLVGKKH